MKFEVSDEDKNKRLDIICSKKFNLTRSLCQKNIEKGLILVNGKKESSSYKLKINDLIEFFDVSDEKKEIKPKNIPLDIVYEDDDLIVLNKQKGLICHPTSRFEEDTLVSALLYHTNNLSDIGGNERKGIVHRLDKDTSGLMLVAKNNNAHIKLQKDIQNKKTVRKYLAICNGIINEDEGTIDKPLVHYLGKTVKMNISSEGLNAITHYKVIERFENSTFLEIQLETGRTHQIRCHFSSINHPLVGDELYGSKGFTIKALSNFKPKGQILMSYFLLFTHPVSGEIMKFEIDENKYHPDLLKALNLLRSYN